MAAWYDGFNINQQLFGAVCSPFGEALFIAEPFKSSYAPLSFDG